jgi:hypothetical protein
MEKGKEITEKIIKCTLCTFLFIAVIDLPYAYYQILRLIGMIGFAVLAYEAHKRDSKIGTLVYCSLALLFQPFYKIALGRDLWKIIDVLVGIGLLFTVFFKSWSRRIE